MIPGPVVAQPFDPLPFTWGGLSANSYLPVFPYGVGSPFPIPTVGRSFYGSVFYPYFSTPMSRWGDEWYTHDLLNAGAKLAYWGDAMIATDPWIMPHYFDALMNRNNNPYGRFPFPWIPPPMNLFGTPPGMASVAPAGSSRVASPQPRQKEKVDSPPRDASERNGAAETGEPPPGDSATERSKKGGTASARDRASSSRTTTVEPPQIATGFPLRGPIRMVGLDENALKQRFGDGQLYSANIQGENITLFVNRENKAYAIDLAKKQAVLIGSVRDNKLYPAK